MPNQAPIQAGSKSSMEMMNADASSGGEAVSFRFACAHLHETASPPEEECDISKLVNPVTFLNWSDNNNMAIVPIVRYMLLCEDWETDPQNNRRISIVGLITNIRSVEDPPYPLLYRELCVFLALTEGRGEGKGHIACIFEDTGDLVFQTSKRRIAFGQDPLEVVAVPFRIRNCTFPKSGIYTLQFCYNDEVVAERPLRMR